jgi:flagellar biogenesis protein FliO
MNQPNRRAILLAAICVIAASDRLAAQVHVSPNGPRVSPARPTAVHDASGSSPVTPSTIATSAASRPLKKSTIRNKSDEKNQDRPPVTTLSPWTAAGALSFVIALILILARLFRKHSPIFQQGLPPDALEVLGRRFLDQRQSIFLVRVASRILVVGSSPNGLHSLGEVADPVEVDLVAGLCRRESNQRGIGTSFLKLLKGQTAAHPTAESGRSRGRTPHAKASPPSLEPTSASLTVESQTGLSQSEFDLRRRLAGSSAAHREESPQELTR